MAWGEGYAAAVADAKARSGATQGIGGIRKNPPVIRMAGAMQFATARGSILSEETRRTGPPSLYSYS